MKHLFQIFLYLKLLFHLRHQLFFMESGIRNPGCSTILRIA